MNWNQLQKNSKKLQEAFLKFNNKSEVFSFLRDLLTEWEILEFTQRLEIAEMLNNWESYKKIEEATWASSTTIARVAKFLNWDFWGYRRVFK